MFFGNVAPQLKPLPLFGILASCGNQIYRREWGRFRYMKILLVEDDAALCDGLSLTLRDDKTEIIQCRTLAQARERLSASRPELIILDVNLPDGSGLSFLRELRQTDSTPVILLTANDMEIDVVTGLELGADDYITKPFSLAVLRARVNAQLRRVAAPSERFAADGFMFDFGAMEFSRGGMNIQLSKTEQRLLRILVSNRGQTVPRADLVDRIWTDGAEYVDENALSVTIKRLRDKLESGAPGVEYIKTVYGIGYTWVVKAHE